MKPLVKPGQWFASLFSPTYVRRTHFGFKGFLAEPRTPCCFPCCTSSYQAPSIFPPLPRSALLTAGWESRAGERGKNAAPVTNHLHRAFDSRQPSRLMPSLAVEALCRPSLAQSSIRAGDPSPAEKEFRTPITAYAFQRRSQPLPRATRLRNGPVLTVTNRQFCGRSDQRWPRRMFRAATVKIHI
jgi:hypothetical protein